MGSNVFANMMEFACVASDGKSIAAMPDVCWTPPQAPPTPTGVPIPYPNTGMASDLTDGSTSVTIGGNPICLKDKSSFKKTSGDEAGSCATKGMVSMKNTGAVFFAAWSMDVKVEDDNVVRNMDIGTHNHGSQVGNSPPWPFLASMGTPGPPGQPPAKCENEAAARDKACKGKETKAERCADKGCRTAMKCELQPFHSTTKTGCCEGQTPHHLIEVHGFTVPSGRKDATRLEQFTKYDDKKAPCVCCDQSKRTEGDHGLLHAVQGMAERSCMKDGPPRSQMGGKDNQWNYGKAKKAGVSAHKATFPQAKCSDGCIEAQLDAYHNKDIGVEGDNTPLRADRTGLQQWQKDEGGAIAAKAGFSPPTVAD